jgi:hypothetical protein
MPNQYSNNIQSKITVNCPCGAEFKTTQKRVDGGRGKFCSLLCKHKYVSRPKRGKGAYNFKGSLAGRFKKGQVSWNSGMKGVYKKDPTKIKKGVHNSPNTEFKKGRVTWNKGKKFPEFSMGKHPNWMGDAVSYAGIHAWVYNNFDKPSLCNRCGTTKAKRFEWHNVSGKYKRDKKDWERLCSLCHCRHHKALKKVNESV